MLWGSIIFSTVSSRRFTGSGGALWDDLCEEIIDSSLSFGIGWTGDSWDLSGNTSGDFRMGSGSWGGTIGSDGPVKDWIIIF